MSTTLAVKPRYMHITFNQDGAPIIADTTIKVIELVLESMAYGWSPEELHFQHPYLTLGQIHAALAYYWDHQGELDRDIERRLQRVERLRRTTGPSPLVKRLQAQGLL